MDEKAATSVIYKKWLNLYPRRFRERLGESMEQTFHDLYTERKGRPCRVLFLLAIFSETAIGIIWEHLLILTQGGIIKNILADPTSAAIASFVLAMPIGLLRLILGSDIDPLVAPIESILTVDGSQPNALGYTIICGRLLLLPLAFLINLRPLLRRDKTDGKRKLYGPNLIVGVILSLLLIFTWGGLLLEEIYCLQGIRCD